MTTRNHARQQGDSRYAMQQAANRQPTDNGNSDTMSFQRSRPTDAPKRKMTIRPDFRQYLSEVMPLVLAGLLGMALYPFMPKWPYISWAYLALYALLLITLATRYAVLRAFSWEISDVKICRRHGILTRQTDYIELYRVVDYRESQTFLQRLFGVKTVVIISTDKSDPSMLICGVPAKEDLVTHTRNLVEQNKKENHIYEITNR